ncbi:MAG TPA: protein phosphatase 2C domain-containing protein [Longimicrobiaceae bacterium]|nr:protein phosphatase 2C domain-containing protein [Longimicrobiaceae bacterium]
MSGIVARSVRHRGLHFELAAFSGQGPRPENQDAFALDGFEATGTVAVADGMGGERGGRLAADTALRALLGAGPIGSLDAARHAVRSADRAVAQAAQENVAERGGMGCALALLALAPDRAGGPGWIGAFAGDVRILSRSPDGTVRLESRDHTPAFARWEAGEIGLDEVTEAEGANRLQRAVGRGGEADAVWIPLRPGWTYLLASDGISKATRLDELGEAMAAPTAEQVVETVRRKVEERGPDDNYTAVAVRLAGDGGPPAARDDDTQPEPPGRGAPIFNPATTVNPTPRRASPLGGIALFLSLAALALAGWAAWSGMEAREQAASRAEVARLRGEIDSIRAMVPPPDTLAAAGTDTILTGVRTPPPGTATPTTGIPR